jgi:hypothetical protein
MEDEDRKSVAVSTAAALKENGPFAGGKVPIPRHLMLLKGSGGTGVKMRAVSTQPTGNGGRKGRRKAGGWRDFTAGQAVDYGKKAWQLAKHLATLINVEDKKFDVDGSAGTAIGTTATVVNLSNIAQGNDYMNRSGDSILVQGMEFRAFAISAAAQLNGSGLRVMIVADRENHGADIVIGDVLQGGTSPLIQPMLATAGSRFDVLYDELIEMNPPSVNTAATTVLLQRNVLPVLIRKWNKHIRYTSTAGADASNWENALFLLAISDENANKSSLYYTFRLHFTDN